MSSAYFKTEGLIIKKTPVGEADFLVRVLTKDFGKMDAVAKGARKTASKLNSHLDILNHIRLQFVKNGEHIPTLTDAEEISRFDSWFANEERISLAEKVLQTVDLVVLPGSKDERLFSMTIELFRSREQNQESTINFIKKFFAHEGHGDSLPEEHKEAILKLWPALKS